MRFYEVQFSHKVRYRAKRKNAIKSGGIGATTLLFGKGKFMMHSTNIDSLRKEPQIHKLLIEELNPKDDDVVIITSSDEDGFQL